MPTRITVPVDREQDARFDGAFALLQERVDLAQVDQLHPVRENAVYTTAVVLWMLVYQRMNPETSLEAAVKKLLETRPDFLPVNKRVSEGRLSSNTGSYSQARSRMPLAAAEWFAEQVGQSLIDAADPSWGARRVFVLDGTTITLAPTPALQAQFPPAENQHGAGVWPVALLTVCHELGSGAALVPEVGAMYGPQAVSETALIKRHLRRLPAASLVMADAGFGIFTVAHHLAEAGHDLLLRMTTSRFKALTKKARRIDSGAGTRTWEHLWQPSPKERATHPELPADAALTVRLHEVAVPEGPTLLLATTLPAPAAELADLYAARGRVEIDIRNLKVVLNTENIRARSVDTFYKELLASLVAYNLTTQFRCQAAALIGEPPRRMSFKRTWTTFHTFLLSAMHTTPDEWRARYRTALSYATLDKLPNRPGRRYAREAYPKRPKTNHFQKRSRKPTPPPD